jgi:hypothetical protein
MMQVDTADADGTEKRQALKEKMCCHCNVMARTIKYRHAPSHNSGSPCCIMLAAAAAQRVKETGNNAREQSISAASDATAADEVITAPVTNGEGGSHISSMNANT